MVLLMCEQPLLMFDHGYNYATTLEGVLKIKEMALTHSEGFLAGEMKHYDNRALELSLHYVIYVTTQIMFGKPQII